MYSTQLAEAYYPLIPQSVQTQVGLEKGFFEENGVTIEDITSFQGGGTTVRGITTGGLGAGAGALAAVVQAYLAGAPIQLAGLLVAKSFTEFHTQVDSNIETIQDVAGGTIAVTNPGSTSEAAAIRAIQNTDGITLDDVEITPAGGLGESITMLQEGNAAVAAVFPPRSTIMKENNESRVVWKTTEKAPGIMDRVLMIGTPTFEEQPELAQGLGQAFVQSMEYARNNIEESAQIYASNNDLPEGIPLKVLQDINPQENYHIEIQENKVKAVGDTMIEQGLIDEQPPWKEVITQSHLPEEHQVDWLK
jgi:NitT/TauT family transport system substrate-binding protein